MSILYTKKKEAIRDQILMKVEAYRHIKGIIFLDDASYRFQHPSIEIEKNEIEVLLMKIHRKRKILITTKYVYIIMKSNVIRIKAKEIDRFDYVDFENLEENSKKASILKKILLKLKISLRIGTYRICKKDGSYIDIHFTNAKFPYCLSSCINKLKFTVRKYESC